MSSFLSRLFGMSTSLTTLSSVPAKSTSGNIAKERLSLIIAAQRGSSMLSGVDMNQLQADVMEVVKRHITVAEGRPISFQVKQNGEINLFEMQIEINEGNGKVTKLFEPQGN